MFQGGAPVLVLNTNAKRESGRKAQFANIQAAKVWTSFYGVKPIFYFLKIFKLRLSQILSLRP
jgi:hypothetical protein